EEEIVVDARGHRCPTPTLRLRRAVERAPAGAVLRLIADDPMARIDAPHFAGEAGLEVLSMDEVGGALTVRVRKPL
ncbi:MAG TPA: sulfurtransferase TusA family protein, partial [Caulobacteraceae bacterium]